MGRRTFAIDGLMLVLISVLTAFGLFTLATIDSSYFSAQGIYILIGLAIIFILSRIDAAMILWFAPMGYIVSILLLIITFLGPSIRGANRWILISGSQLQPSELIKPLLLLFWAWSMQKYSPRQLKHIGIHIILFVIPFFLVFRQPDLGTSIVYALTWIVMMLSAGLSLGLFSLGSVFFGGFLPLLWERLKDYQRSRILSFINPFVDPKGAGYNAIQATIAAGSGQFFGKGLGFGTQSHLRFLPEHHTDFIFASIVEELGFFGGAILIATYVLLLWRILHTSWKYADQPYIFYFGAGIFGMILAQVFINAGMNMAILPITGITMPFVSYGGSSILSLYITFGIFWALVTMEKARTIAHRGSL